MTVTLYGIPNCDSCRKARRWLDDAGIDHAFVDFRADPVNASRLENWAAALGWETLLNKRGRTWRELPEEQKAAVDADEAVALMRAHPLLIKRPVLEHGTGVACGFSPARYASLLS